MTGPGVRPAYRSFDAERGGRVTVYADAHGALLAAVAPPGEGSFVDLTPGEALEVARLLDRKGDLYRTSGQGPAPAP